MEWLKRLRASVSREGDEHAEEPWHWQVRSYDGYQREAALKTAAHHPRSDAIAAILERLNDWVPQVRERASFALESHLRADFFDAWVDSIPEIANLARYRRAPHAENIAKVREFFLRNDLARWLTPRLATLDSERAYFLFDIVSSARYLLTHELIETALSSPHIGIARRAFECALKQSADPEPLLVRAFSSRIPALRADALRAFVRLLPERSESRIIVALSDASPRVRAVAAFHAKQYVAAQHALDHALDATTDAPLLMLGLSRVLTLDAHGATLERLFALTQHARAAVRIQAWLALLRVDAANAVEHITAFLEDRSAKVRHAALRALRNMTEPIEREWAEARCHAVLARSERQGQQLVTALLQTLRNNGAWEQLAFGLQFESMGTHHIDLQLRPHGFFGEWLDRNGALAHAPSAPLAKLISERLQLHSNPSLVKKIQQKLADCIARPLSETRTV